MMKDHLNRTEALLDFIEKSPSAFQVVSQIAAHLEAQGYARLEESAGWKLSAGGKYYVTRNQTSLIAFTLPKQKPVSLLLAASHSDSPMFKLKHEYSSPAFGKYFRLNTDVKSGFA